MSVRLSNTVLANLRAAPEEAVKPVPSTPAPVKANAKKKKKAPAKN